MSNKIIINTRDGSVIELRDSVIVDLDNLTDKQNALWEEWEEGGNDSTACELGRVAGKDLHDFFSKRSKKSTKKPIKKKSKKKGKAKR